MGVGPGKAGIAAVPPREPGRFQGQGPRELKYGFCAKSAADQARDEAPPHRRLNTLRVWAEPSGTWGHGVPLRARRQGSPAARGKNRAGTHVPGPQKEPEPKAPASAPRQKDQPPGQPALTMTRQNRRRRKEGGPGDRSPAREPAADRDSAAHPYAEPCKPYLAHGAPIPREGHRAQGMCAAGDDLEREPASSGEAIAQR